MSAPFSPAILRLAEELGDALRLRHWRLAVAESCTGGMLGAAITAVPGASDYFAGGVIAYGRSAKERLLDVDSQVLREQGAVSEAVAAAMAAGIQKRLDADLVLSVTGTAGPATGSEPSSIFICGLSRGQTHSIRRLVSSSDRHGDRLAAVQAALELATDCCRRPNSE